MLGGGGLEVPLNSLIVVAATLPPSIALTFQRGKSIMRFSGVVPPIKAPLASLAILFCILASCSSAGQQSKDPAEAGSWYVLKQILGRRRVGWADRRVGSRWWCRSERIRWWNKSEGCRWWYRAEPRKLVPAEVRGEVTSKRFICDWGVSGYLFDLAGGVVAHTFAVVIHILTKHFGSPLG